ncbi:hypothetical protein Q7P35_009191 [Cladosporium inversicolor]
MSKAVYTIIIGGVARVLVFRITKPPSLPANVPVARCSTYAVQRSPSGRRLGTRHNYSRLLLLTLLNIDLTFTSSAYATRVDANKVIGDGAYGFIIFDGTHVLKIPRLLGRLRPDGILIRTSTTSCTSSIWSAPLPESMDITRADVDGCTAKLDLLHLSNIVYSIMTWQIFSFVQKLLHLTAELRTVLTHQSAADPHCLLLHLSEASAELENAGCHKQLAGIHGQLASQKFDIIGSFGPDGSLCPLLDQVQWWQPLGENAFPNASDYINSYLKEYNTDRTESARALYPAIKEKLAEYLEQNAGNPTLNAPYRLIRPDLNFRNLLVTQDEGKPPKFCGVIDWDWSDTGLLYFLCEYPLSIQDPEFWQESRAENKILRKHFVRCLANYFPKRSADRAVDTFALHVWEPEQEFYEVEDYMNDIGVEMAAYPITGWQPDSESKSDDEDGE